MKKYTINLILIVLLTCSGCKKIVDLNPDLRTVIAICDELLNNPSNMSILSIDLNDGWVNVSETESSAGDGATFKLTGNEVSYSYQVAEWVIGTPSFLSPQKKSYSGKLNDAAFIKNQKNKIEIVRDGSEWKLLVNGKNENIQSSKPGTNPTGTITDTIYNQVVSGNNQDQKIVSFNLPSGIKTLTVMTTEYPGEKNSADLFVRKGQNPVIISNSPYQYTADCASIKPNRENEMCTFSNPESGTWKVMLYGFNIYFDSRLIIMTSK